MHFQSGETGVLDLDDIQLPYRICRSLRRRRTISLSFEHEHGLRLMVPMRTSLRQIHHLLMERTPWIRRRLAHLNQHRPQPSADEFKDGASLPYLGREYRIQITLQQVRKGYCQLGNNTLEVVAKSEEIARQTILDWYRKQAETLLTERIQPLADKLHVKYRRLILSNARRLWGSCTARKDIRINWRLIMAPLPLVDCVLAHELCHIVHMNHSKKFWALLESLIPDQRERKKQLRALEADLLRRGRSR